MPSVYDIAYSSKSNVTITLASLADSSGRQSTGVDNSTTKYVDVLVSGFITTGAAPTTDSTFSIYAFGSANAGGTYSDGATGTDGAWTNGDNAKLIAVIQTDNSATTAYEFGPYSIAAPFGGHVPEFWGIGIENNTGDALDSTGSNHEIHYVGINYNEETV